MSTGKAPMNTEVLRRLSEQMSRPGFRKSFFNDPYTAMERAGIAAADIPDQIIDVLSDLTLAELEVVAQIHSQFRNIKDVASDIKGGFLF